MFTSRLLASCCRSARSLAKAPRRVNQSYRCSSSSSAPSAKKNLNFAYFVAGGTLVGSYILTREKFQKAKVLENRVTIPVDLAPTERKYASKSVVEMAKREIEKIVGPEYVSSAHDDISLNSDSAWATHHPKDDSQKPIFVVYPKSTEEVSKILKVAFDNSVPVVPISGATSLEGHFINTFGGFVINFREMAKVVELHKDDLDVVVQPGIDWESLNDYLADHNLFFGPDPGPGAEIGGMIGTSCSGTNASRYGTMKENVVNLTVVLADGTVVKTRGRPRKSAAGYALTQWFIGAEGTLGIVTEATLKVVPKPKNVSVGVLTFPEISQATETVQDILHADLALGAIELLDDEMMRAINIAGTTDRKWKETSTLFLKFSGPDVKQKIEAVKSIAKNHNFSSIEFATDPQQVDVLWSARKVALWSTIDASPSPSTYKVWTTDVAVPISKLTQVVNETKHDIEKSGIYGTIVGHVGDGNFHAIIVYDKDTQFKAVSEVVDRMVLRAQHYEGTCTGEHGVGIGKRAYLEGEVGKSGVDLMRRMKFALDPKLILNPGKVVPLTAADYEELDY